MLLRDGAKQTDFLNHIVFDYLKSSALLYNLNFIGSSIISTADFNSKVANVITELNSIEVVELIVFVESIETINSIFTAGSTDTPFRNDLFIFDTSLIYKMASDTENKIFNFIKEEYEDVVKLVDFIFKQTELEYQNFKKGIINAENSKNLYKQYLSLQKSEGVKRFLEDFAPLQKKNITKKIYSLYEDVISGKEIKALRFRENIQITNVIVNGQNLLYPVSYIMSKGLKNCNLNSDYAIMDFSQILLSFFIDSKDNNNKDNIKKKIALVNNFAFLRRAVLCSSDSHAKILHIIRNIEFKKKLSQEDTEKISFDFIKAGRSDSFSTSSPTISSLLSIFLYLDFVRNFKKAKEKIDREVISIIKKEIPIETKLTELELYIESLAVRLLNGMKIENKDENSAFYSAIKEFLKENIKQIAERITNV